MLLVDRYISEGITLDANRSLLVVDIEKDKVRLGLCFHKKPGIFHQELASKTRLVSYEESRKLLLFTNRAFMLYEHGIEEVKPE